MAANLKRQSFPACGRLVVLQNQTEADQLSPNTGPDQYARNTAINFPAMPDAIELVRTADYTVSSPWGFPDGNHYYKGTAPLSIPFSFKLHAYDIEFCPFGAKSLLQTAADLQALVLPFSHIGVPNNAGTGVNDSGAQRDQGNTSTSNVQPYLGGAEAIFPPATCYLELMKTEVGSVGICCVGYVKEVRIRLLGPFLRGQAPAQNLPSAAEFEFTFVHHPGHMNALGENAFGSIREQQAFAGIVQANFYNTINLVTNQAGYVSFNDTGATNSATTPLVPTPPVPEPMPKPTPTVPVPTH